MNVGVVTAQTAKPTETKWEPQRSKASTPSGMETTERPDFDTSARSPERLQSATAPQFSTPDGMTASNRTDPNVGRPDQKIVRPGPH